MFTKLLVAYDGSDGAKRALNAGIALAKSLALDLHAVMVEEGLPPYAGTMLDTLSMYGQTSVAAIPIVDRSGEMEAVKDRKDAYFEQLSREASELTQSQGVALHAEVVVGHEVGAIVDYVKRHGFDLLLIGAHGHSALYERIIGTTAHGLLSQAPCNVLIVKQA